VPHRTKQCGTALSGLLMLLGEMPCHIAWCGVAPIGVFAQMLAKAFSPDKNYMPT